MSTKRRNINSSKKKNANHDDAKFKIDVSMIAPVGGLATNNQSDLFFDLARERKTFKVKASLTNLQFKKKITEHFGIPAGIPTLWICARDPNHRFRPRVVWPYQDSQTIGNSLKIHSEVHEEIPKLFVEVMKGPSGDFVRPAPKTQNNIMLFVKFVNELNEVSFIGEYYVQREAALSLLANCLSDAGQVPDGVYFEFQKEGEDGGFISEDTPLEETDLVDGDTILITSEQILIDHPPAAAAAD